MDDLHLTVALDSGADADRGNLELPRDVSGDLRWYPFEHDGEHTGFLQGFGVCHQTRRHRRLLALHVITAQLVDGLRRLADVTHDRDARFDDAPAQSNPVMENVTDA